MRGSKWLILFLVGCLLLSPLSALPLPESSSSGVWLSDEEVAEMEAAMLEAQEALDRSSELIKKQEKDLKKLWIACAVLGSVIVIEAVTELIQVSR